MWGFLPVYFKTVAAVDSTEVLAHRVIWALPFGALTNMLVGVWLFHDQLRRFQLLAVVLAVIGVIVLTVSGGVVPWVALSLALTFTVYALAARRLTLTTIGFMQFLAPTLQFGTGIYYGETLTTAHLICFGFIWTAVAFFIFDAVKKTNVGARLAREATQQPQAARR